LSIGKNRNKIIGDVGVGPTVAVYKTAPQNRRGHLQC